MDTYSAADAARRLGTSVPRVKRAITELGLRVDERGGGRVNLSAAQLDALRARLGVSAAIPGLSRSEVAALAALARAPLGIGSVRALAVRAGLSPTAAGRAVDGLCALGYATRSTEWVAQGRAREVSVIRANFSHPRWAQLSEALSPVRPPARREQPRASRVPVRLRHLFWNTAPAQLETESHGSYIAQRLLSSADLDGIAWGARNLQGVDWRRAAKARGLPGELRSLALNIAAHPPA